MDGVGFDRLQQFGDAIVFNYVGALLYNFVWCNIDGIYSRFGRIVLPVRCMTFLNLFLEVFTKFRQLCAEFGDLGERW